MHGLLIGTSQLLAMRLQEPAVVLTDEETAGFLKAAQNLARHYSIETTQKTIDTVAFIASAATVFGTRIITVIANRGRARFERQQSGEGAVVDMTGAPYIRPDETAPHNEHDGN